MTRLQVSALRPVRVAAALVAVVVWSAACSSADDAKESSTPTIEVSTGASLTVRVEPSLPGPGAWEVMLQEQRDGTWARVGDAQTTGDPEVTSWDVPAGEYRVVVPAQHGRPAAASSAVEARVFVMAPPGFQPGAGRSDLRFVLERADDPALRVVDDTLFLGPEAAHGG